MWEQKIEALTNRLSELNVMEEKLHAEANGWAEKRDKLNERFKSLRAEMIALKGERDELNENVKWLKQQRTELKTKLLGKIDEVKRLRQGIRESTEDRASGNPQELQEEIADIEWRIQTTSTSLEQDRRLVERVKELETQLAVHRKVEKTKQKTIELQVGIDALETEGRQCHTKLGETAKKSQELHERMVVKMDEVKKVKAEADNAHQLFVQTKEKLRPVKEEINEIVNQLRALKTEVREKENMEKKRNIEAWRSRLENQAKEKLKRGEKLTWEEFQVLAEKEMGAQD